jgi:hypothetical protein
LVFIAENLLWFNVQRRCLISLFAVKHAHRKDTNQIIKIIQKVQDKTIQNGFTPRDIYHGHHWSGLSNAEEVQKACDFAESLGWITKVIDPLPNRARYKYYVHPELLNNSG